jgi:hypothetical protein
VVLAMLLLANGIKIALSILQNLLKLFFMVLNG